MAHIYRIRNLESGKCYVGSSANYGRRWSAHRYHLRRGTHHSPKLQRAWNKYGEQVFAFEVLLECAGNDVLFYEQLLIDGFDSCNGGYNLAPVAGSRLGLPHDPDTVAKMREFQRSNRKKYAFNGEMLCLAEIAERVGMSRDLLVYRVTSAGMSIEQAVSRKHLQKNRKFEALGQCMTIREWVAKYGINEGNLRGWLRRGMTMEQALAKAKEITPHELGRLFGLDGNMVGMRVAKGWQIADALTIPKIGAGGHHHMKRKYRNAA